MAVLVLNIKIKNLNTGDTKSDSDNAYPDSDAKIFGIGCVSNELLIELNIFIRLHEMPYCASAFNSIVYSLPISCLSFQIIPRRYWFAVSTIMKST